MNDRTNTHGVSIQRLLEICEKSNFYTEWAEEYAEPGYSSGDRGIVFADWNDGTRYNRETKEREVTSTIPSRMANIFERLGFEIEWSDEWCTCSECNKAFRTSPDCWGWRPSYRMPRCGEIYCVECWDSEFSPEAQLRDYRDSIVGDLEDVQEDCEESEDGWIDVRLQFSWDGGAYNVRSGDASYDLDHTGDWGASCISKNCDCADLADDLIGQVLESIAQREEV